jgi:hypothetical protein
MGKNEVADAGQSLDELAEKPTGEAAPAAPTERKVEIF